MPYLTEPCTGDAGQIDEASRFLASFVADGEGASSDTEGANPDTWRARLRWWWTTNPYCVEGSPKGLLLRRESGDLAGFLGFIPHDYVLEGERVPSLISTTTFVRRENRDAALGLFLRAHRLREKYHLVDGGPNAEAQALLSKTGYQHAKGGRVFLYPVKKRGLRPWSLLLRAARVVTPKSKGLSEGDLLVTKVGEVAEVPPIRDGKLRKHVDRVTLKWYLSSGSREKFFVGLCDGRGLLKSYVLGVVRRKLGIRVLVIIDGASFEGESGKSLDDLVAHVAGNPAECGLPAELDFVAWPVSGSGGRRSSPFALKYDPKLFYRVPEKWGAAERVCLPLEGDKAFL